MKRLRAVQLFSLKILPGTLPRQRSGLKPHAAMRLANAAGRFVTPSFFGAKENFTVAV